jgi:hypothetical protein
MWVGGEGGREEEEEEEEEEEFALGETREVKRGVGKETKEGKIVGKEGETGKRGEGGGILSGETNSQVTDIQERVEK